MLNERVQMVIKRATAAADANKVLSSRLASVERERDINRALMGTERQQKEEMISVAEAARAQVASREVQLQRYETHRPINKLHVAEFANDLRPLFFSPVLQATTRGRIWSLNVAICRYSRGRIKTQGPVCIIV